MSTTTDPVPEQWTPDHVTAAFQAGQHEAIQAARYAGLLDSILNPTQEA